MCTLDLCAGKAFQSVNVIDCFFLILSFREHPPCCWVPRLVLFILLGACGTRRKFRLGVFSAICPCRAKSLNYLANLKAARIA